MLFPVGMFRQGIILSVKGCCCLDDLIYDAVSIFTQILQKFAPERAGEFEFQLLGYGASCAFVLLTLWMLYKILSAFGNVMLKWLSGGM